MEKGLIKWTPKELARPRPVTIQRSPTVTRALALAHNKQIRPASGADHLNVNKANYPVSQSSQPDGVADLIRSCSVQGIPYAARLIKSSSGVWEYAQSIRISEGLYWEQYADAPPVSVPSYVMREDERCAVCGATGRSAIYCHSCERFMCWGTTVRRWFRCACGLEGELEPTNLIHRGVIPSVRL